MEITVFFLTLLSALTIMGVTFIRRRYAMEYEYFRKMMEEVGEVHKLVQKLTMQSCHHLTIEQMRLISFISKNEVNQKQIAKELRITEATLSVRIRRLVDMGIVEKKMNPDDKRNYQIVLSDFGKTIMNELKQDFDHIHHVICQNMTIDDYDAVLNVIRKIKKNLKEEIK